MGSERIGVFGGTFDPPHVGHLVAAVNVAYQLSLDTVLFVVANIPWQKVEDRPISSVAHRFAMVELALGERREFLASPIEIEQGGDSVTANTLETLAEIYPARAPVLILGSDAAAGMDTWRRADDLKKLATVAVVDRPGTTGERPPQGFDYEVVSCPLMDVSSSDIRDRARHHLPIDYLLPDHVRDYVVSHGLYT